MLRSLGHSPIKLPPTDAFVTRSVMSFYSIILSNEMPLWVRLSAMEVGASWRARVIDARMAESVASRVECAVRGRQKGGFANSSMEKCRYLHTTDVLIHSYNTGTILGKRFHDCMRSIPLVKMHFASYRIEENITSLEEGQAYEYIYHSKHFKQ